MTTSQASRVFGIPYNSLLMYVRGKYGKSLRLDVLKMKSTSANDNLNTIGNSRSTPKEKGSIPGIKREEFNQITKDIKMKSSHDGMHPPLFSFDNPHINPFSNGLLHFPPLGEPFGLLGLAGMPPADPRIKDLMQSLQSQQAALNQTDRIREVKEEVYADNTKENNENNKQLDIMEKMNLNSIPMQLHEEAREKALAALLMRATGQMDDNENNEENENEPKNPSDESREEDFESMDTGDIPQMTIKPVDALPIVTPIVTSIASPLMMPPIVTSIASPLMMPPKPLELNIPNNAEIPAQ